MIQTAVQTVEVKLCQADRELIRRLTRAKNREAFTSKPAEIGAMSVKVSLDDGAIAPTRAHSTDAGMDLYAREDTVIPRAGKTVAEWDENERCKTIKHLDNSACFDTGVHVELPHGYYGKIESKSGLNVKHSVVSCGGVIDEGYTGSIVVKLYNFGTHSYTVHAGDKIAQLIIQPCIYPTVSIVESINAETERGDNGFGSTGK